MKMFLYFDHNLTVSITRELNVPVLELACSFNVILSVLSAEYLAADEFPEHIKSLVQKEKESEEQEKRQREIERNTCKVHGTFLDQFK